MILVFKVGPTSSPSWKEQCGLKNDLSSLAHMDKIAALSTHGVGEYGLLYTVLQGEVTCAHVHALTHKYALLCSTAASCTGQARHTQT